MKRDKLILAFVMLVLLGACSTHRRVDGWYQVADYPDNCIIGEPLATVNDFETMEIARDSFVISGETVRHIYIYGRVKPDKRRFWADATERMIGKRLGFVYNDSLIINARIESGSFQINSTDSTLLKAIYNSIINEK